jgi:predicted O-methyltransferase YrrM
MKIRHDLRQRVSILLVLVSAAVSYSAPSPQAPQMERDKKVRDFLQTHKYQWRYENISEEDGEFLYNLILEKNYQSALDIGTSTGHSAIWIAWAMSKTGGKLITIEIDEGRYKQAMLNFERAGLLDFIDARLADAHDLVPQLEGPFDFVFLDADKNWYVNYLNDVLPKLKVGGCFTAHNVRNLRYMRGIREFLEHIQSLPELETSIDETSSMGISVSYKTK